MIGLMHKDRSDGLIIIDQTNAQWLIIIMYKDRSDGLIIIDQTNAQWLIIIMYKDNKKIHRMMIN